MERAVTILRDVNEVVVHYKIENYSDETYYSAPFWVHFVGESVWKICVNRLREYRDGPYVVSCFVTRYMLGVNNREDPNIDFIFDMRGPDDQVFHSREFLNQNISTIRCFGTREFIEADQLYENIRDSNLLQVCLTMRLTAPNS